MHWKLVQLVLKREELLSKVWVILNLVEEKVITSLKLLRGQILLKKKDLLYLSDICFHDLI